MTSLDDFMAWNDELYALGQAGVPIDVDLGRAGGDTVAALERINAAVARRVSQGASLDSALQSNDSVVPSAYGSLVQTGLRGGDLSAALAGSNRLAESIDELGHVFRLSLLYPLIVCGFAYAGLLTFCLFFFPALDGLHRELRLPAGTGLSVLRTLRESLLYWAAIPLLLAALFLLWRLYFSAARGLSRRRFARVLRWLPGMSSAVRDQQYANLADSLSLLLEAGTPLDEALRLAAGATGIPLARAADSAASPVSSSANEAFWLPPFLHYALWQAEEAVGRGRALSMAAEMYRTSARRRAERIRLVAPPVLCIAVGGSVTLLYGLALFIPIIEMLYSLST